MHIQVEVVFCFLASDIFRDLFLGSYCSEISLFTDLELIFSDANTTENYGYSCNACRR